MLVRIWEERGRPQTVSSPHETQAADKSIGSASKTKHTHDGHRDPNTTTFYRIDKDIGLPSFFY